MTLTPPPSTIILSPSPACWTAIMIAHVGSAAALGTVLGGPEGAAAGILLLLLGLAAAARVGLLRGRHAPAVLVLRPGAEAELELRDGRRVSVVARRVGRRWVSLSAAGRHGRAFFLTRDMAGAAAFRLVRLWALWGRLPAGPGSPRTKSAA